MEKQRTNNGPLKELADKHSIYTPLRSGTLQQHRHTHVDVRVAQVWRIVPEAHFGWTALQLLHHMADTIVYGLEWVLGMRFEAETQVRRAEGEAVHAWLGELAGLGDRLNGLDLEPEDTVVVPPLGICTAVVPAFDLYSAYYRKGWCGRVR
jgi:hypothetical protein